MRIGVNTGKVFTGDFGPSVPPLVPRLRRRDQHRGTGDEQGRGRAGARDRAIVLERSRTAFETTPIEPFAAKGKSEPVRASIVGPIIGAGESRRARDADGRSRARARGAPASRARRQAGRPAGSSTSRGGPGLGKTRLVQDLIERGGDVFVFHTRCEEYESLDPVLPAPRAVPGGARAVPHRRPEVESAPPGAAQQVDPTLVPWVPLSACSLGVDLPHTPETKALDERFIPERLADVMMRFLYTSLAGHHDDARRRGRPAHGRVEPRPAAAALAQAGADRKQVLVVTHDGYGRPVRPRGDDDLNSLSFTLAPLSVTAAIAMINAATDDDPLLPDDRRRDRASLRGQPAVPLRAARHRARDGLHGGAAGLGRGGRRRATIDRLSPPPTARCCATRPCSARASTRRCSRPRCTATTSSSTPRSGPGFSDLVERRPASASSGSATPSSATPPTRASRSGAVACCTGEWARRSRRCGPPDEEVGALALHYFEAQRHDKAWPYCRLAGDRARAVYANVEAARFYERALAAGPPSARARRRRARRGVDRPRLGAGHDRALRRLVRRPPPRHDAARGRAGRPGTRVRQPREGAHAVGCVRASPPGDAGRSPAGGVARRDRGGRRPGDAARVPGRDPLAAGPCARGDPARARRRSPTPSARTTSPPWRSPTRRSTAPTSCCGEPEKAIYERKAVEIYAELGQARLLGMHELNLGVQSYADGDWCRGRPLVHARAGGLPPRRRPRVGRGRRPATSARCSSAGCARPGTEIARPTPAGPARRRVHAVRALRRGAARADRPRARPRATTALAALESIVAEAPRSATRSSCSRRPCTSRTPTPSPATRGRPRGARRGRRGAGDEAVAARPSRSTACAPSASRRSDGSTRPSASSTRRLPAPSASSSSSSSCSSVALAATCATATRRRAEPRRSCRRSIASSNSSGSNSSGLAVRQPQPVDRRVDVRDVLARQGRCVLVDQARRLPRQAGPQPDPAGR